MLAPSHWSDEPYRLTLTLTYSSVLPPIATSVSYSTYFRTHYITGTTSVQRLYLNGVWTRQCATITFEWTLTTTVYNDYIWMDCDHDSKQISETASLSNHSWLQMRYKIWIAWLKEKTETRIERPSNTFYYVTENTKLDSAEDLLVTMLVVYQGLRTMSCTSQCLLKYAHKTYTCESQCTSTAISSVSIEQCIVLIGQRIVLIEIHVYGNQQCPNWTMNCPNWTQLNGFKNGAIFLFARISQLVVSCANYASRTIGANSTVRYRSSCYPI